MKKLVITFVLFVLCTVMAAAVDFNIENNLLANPGFTGGLSPWIKESGIAEDFTYFDGKLTFKNTSSNGCITPEYVYQDVILPAPEGKVFTVGLSVDADDVHKVSLFDDNSSDITVMLEWFSDTTYTQSVKSEKVKGLLPYHILKLDAGVFGKDYFLEQKVYCPLNSGIKACRFSLYVDKFISGKVTFKQAWMVDEGYAKPYAALTCPLTATGNYVVPDNGEITYIGSYYNNAFTNTEFSIYPAMAPDDDVTAGRIASGIQPKSTWQNEKLCLEMKAADNNGNIVHSAKQYFQIDDYSDDGMYAGYALKDNYFKNRAGSFGPLFGVAVNSEYDFYAGTPDPAAYLYRYKCFDGAGTDVIINKVTPIDTVSSIGGSTIFGAMNSFASYCPNTNVIFDVSEFGPTSIKPAQDILNAVKQTENSSNAYSKAMGFIVNDRLSPANLEETVYLRDKIRESDNKLVVGSRVSASPCDLAELPYYSRAAGDVLFADILPKDGMKWQSTEDFADNIIIKKLNEFICPVFGIISTSAKDGDGEINGIISPKKMLSFMYKGRKLSGIIFDVNCSEPFNTFKPYAASNSFAAAMVIKSEILHNNLNLIPSFCPDDNFEKDDGYPVNYNDSAKYLGNLSVEAGCDVSHYSDKAGNEEVWVLYGNGFSDDTTKAFTLSPLVPDVTADCYKIDFSDGKVHKETIELTGSNQYVGSKAGVYVIHIH